MYSLPSSLDLDFFLGAETSQICVGLYSVQIQFSEEINIVCQSSMLIKINDTVSKIFCDQPATAASLFSLLGKAIVGIERLNDKDLVLSFNGEVKLTILDSSDHYESYVIWKKNECIAVV